MNKQLILLSLCFFVGPAFAAAQLTVQCKNWEGEILVDINSDAPPFADKLRWTEFLRLARKKEGDAVFKTEEAKVYNIRTRDWATDKQENGWFFSKVSDGTIEATFGITQEAPQTEEDNGKGVTLDIPGLVSPIKVVGSTTVEYASIGSGLVLGWLNGGAGEDDIETRQVVCKVAFSKN